MKYRVVYTTRSNLELQQATLWWAENRDSQQAAQWLASFEAAIAGLNENPQRYARAHEDEFFDVTPAAMPPIEQTNTAISSRFMVSRHPLAIYIYVKFAPIASEPPRSYTSSRLIWIAALIPRR